MELANTALVHNAGSAAFGSVQSSAQMLVLKKAIDQQAQGALQLLDALPAQPALASSGSLGTRLNVYA